MTKKSGQFRNACKTCDGRRNVWWEASRIYDGKCWYLLFALQKSKKIYLWVNDFRISKVSETLKKWLEGVEDVHAEANELCNELRRCLVRTTLIIRFYLGFQEGNPEKITELCMKIGNFSNELQNAQNNLRIENWLLNKSHICARLVLLF